MNSSDRTPAADILRVISIGIVGWYHIWQQSWLNPSFTLFGHYFNLYPLVSRGYMFVYVMFMLSGFVLMLGSLNGRYTSIKRFYLGRIARIVPSYLVCLVIFGCFVIIPDDPYPSTGFMLKDVISHLTFTHNLIYEGYQASRFSHALWTIAVEMQFYLIFPLLARCFKKKPYLVFAGMLAFSTLVKLLIRIYIPDSTLYINRLSTTLDVFGVGMLGAYVFCRVRERNLGKYPKLCFAFAALVCAAGALFMIKRLATYTGSETERQAQMWFALPLSLLMCVFTVCLSLSYGWIKKLCSNRIVLFFAGISYNFYIWHQTLAVRLKQARIPSYTGDAPNMDGQTVWQHRYTLVCFIVAILFAAFMTYIIEKPCARALAPRREEKLSQPPNS